MKINTTILGAGILALLCSANHLSASVLFDSLPGTVQGTPKLDNVIPYQSFDVGSTPATLTSVVLSMANEMSAGSGPADFTVSLVAANGPGNIPGTVVAVLDGNSNPATAGNYTYTPSSPTALAANTSYYIELGFQPGLAVYEFDIADIVSGTASLGIQSYNGSSWSSVNISPEAISMEINATLSPLSPVPEPADWAAISAAMLGSVWIVKRRMTPARA